MSVVYKITRQDGLEYIGITNNLQSRLSSHKRSLRFSQSPIAHVEILFEGDYGECEVLEEYFIDQYHTYTHGLNCTRTGKGKSDCLGFNTLGFVFSDESRRRMSEAAKRRGPNNIGYRHSEVNKQHWSNLRKGKVWGPVKLNPEDVLEKWNCFEITQSHIDKYCTAGQQLGSQLKSKNGRPLSKERIFALSMCAIFNASPNGIMKVLKKCNLKF